MGTNYHTITGPAGETLLYDPETMVFYKSCAGEAAADPLPKATPPRRAGVRERADVDAREPQATGDRPVLERLVLMVTTECNLRCRYCYADGGNYGMCPQHMSEDVALRAVRWAEEHFAAVGVVQFFGGEPTLNSRVIRAVCEAFEQTRFQGHIQYGLVSNGVYLPSDLLETIHRYPFRVTYSVDGPAEVHDLQRVNVHGRGSFQALWENLCVLQEEGIEVGTEMTLTPQAIEHNCGVWELAQFSQDILRMREPHIVPVCTEDPESPFWWDEERTEALVESYRAATRAAFFSFLDGRPVTFSLFSGILRALITKRGRDVICPAGAATLAIDPEGGIYPCFMFAGQEEYRLGSIFDAGLEPLLATLERFMAFNVKVHQEECRSCWARRLCTGCMGNIQITNGALQGVWRPMCHVMKAIAEEVMLLLASIRDKPVLWSRFVAAYKQHRLGPVFC